MHPFLPSFIQSKIEAALPPWIGCADELKLKEQIVSLSSVLTVFLSVFQNVHSLKYAHRSIIINYYECFIRINAIFFGIHLLERDSLVLTLIYFFRSHWLHFKKTLNWRQCALSLYQKSNYLYVLVSCNVYYVR